VKDLFITGTDTGVGKTVLSALLTSNLDAAYWKPIQTGRSEGETDREAVMRWSELPANDTPAESFIFDSPVSPHLAAREMGINIDLAEIRRPHVRKPRLIIEGAGGVLVPINGQDLMLDLMARLDAGVVVASRTTLGTINHTLLTVDRIRRSSLDLIGVVMIGEENVENREAVERYGAVAVVGWIPVLPSINRSALRHTFDKHFDQAAFDA
jgi:dethiobiotin synthetase